MALKLTSSSPDHTARTLTDPPIEGVPVGLGEVGVVGVGVEGAQAKTPTTRLKTKATAINLLIISKPPSFLQEHFSRIGDKEMPSSLGLRRARRR
jgi:hypothetical protein